MRAKNLCQRFDIQTKTRDNVSYGTNVASSTKGFRPEQFLFVTVDLAKGKMKRTTGAISEKEMPDHLTSNGMPVTEIDDKFAHARANPI